MRCRACNKQLNDNESVYKDSETGEDLDMCNICIRKSYASFDLESDDDRKYVETLFTKIQ
jgi:hypothetical protein